MSPPPLRGPPTHHPRARGERGTSMPSLFLRIGPSPPAQGAHARGHYTARYRGTIPACAGSTWRRFLLATLDVDHPRLRGEHLLITPTCILVSGPSPPARGALKGDPLPGRRFGTIPACAGSTRFPRLSTPGETDHPRLRGEHGTRDIAGAPMSGPSPPARGAPFVTWQSTGG